ncbi:MAG: 2-C-methyl-D-erythritol 2,4-cyclodiphosphate synthase [Deltaproteobacteria bacterium]|nr:2-C-methyl-D-erythritol 2,4-cyclodiphosphate synthase [Deltaproteobacteria bacterium]
MGHGFDFYLFAPDRLLWLGGVLFPDPPELLALSDTDVVGHFLIDALKGPGGLGDIGTVSC